MTQDVSLKASPRDGAGKGVARKLRAEGLVPAVLYGGDEDTVSLTVDSHEAFHLFQNISVDNTIIELDIEGEKGGVRTLVRDIQAHAYKPEILHIDFLRIQKGVALEVDIPVHVEGTAVGVKNNGGILDQVIHTVHVRCIPSMIPDEFVVNIEGLDIGDHAYVSAIEPGEGVEILTDPETIVASVSLPKAAPVEEEELDEAAEPELVGEVAEGEEGDAGAEGEEE
jgi:large subunit ribosomal protein L25